jgi:DNA-binding protein HU-beta
MNQAELYNAIAIASGISKKEIESVLKAAGEVVTEQLKAGDEVTLPGLGKFSTKAKAARTGRNPATGEEIQIPAKTVPHFSASKVLKDAVAE